MMESDALIPSNLTRAIQILDADVQSVRRHRLMYRIFDVTGVPRFQYQPPSRIGCGIPSLSFFQLRLSRSSSFFQSGEIPLTEQTPKMAADEEFPGENNRRSRNLRDNMLSFRKIDQNSILNRLRELGIIDEKEAELITRQNHWKERAYYLLETILQKGNQAIDVLVQVLREQGKHDMLALLETGKNSQPSKEIFLNNSSNHWQSLHLDEGDYDGWGVWLDSFYRWQLIHSDDEDFLSSPDDDLVVWMETVKQPRMLNGILRNSFSRLQSQHWDD